MKIYILSISLCTDKQCFNIKIFDFKRKKKSFVPTTISFHHACRCSYTYPNPNPISRLLVTCDLLRLCACHTHTSNSPTQRKQVYFHEKVLKIDGFSSYARKLLRHITINTEAPSRSVLLRSTPVATQPLLFQRFCKYSFLFFSCFKFNFIL